MKERENFLHEVMLREKPVKSLCQEYGISEKTGYKWKKRFEEEGKRGLLERSRAPRDSPGRLDEDTVINIINLRNAHPTWGPKKICALYPKMHPKGLTPSLSSINRRNATTFGRSISRAGGYPTARSANRSPYAI